MSGSLDDVKQRILTRVPLADLVGETVQLDRGTTPKGCCPFHAEKSGSFYVYPNRYYCYGCKAGGDAIEFVRKTQGLGFVEALRFLAGRYNIEATELDEADRQFGRQKEEASLFEMLAVAQDYFSELLWTPAGEETRAYLTGRGYSADSIKDYGFGLTPEESFGLVRFLRSKNFREADMIEASLATKSTRDNRTFDFFRSRITIPIRDGQGRIIAFGGRTTDNNPAKYLNSRDSVLFDKSNTLYGFDRARKVMRQRGRAILVEGYMDTLQLWQSGFPETVACLGTSFTEYHLKQLKHATSKVVLLLDGDEAGQRATLAAVNVALSARPECQRRLEHSNTTSRHAKYNLSDHTTRGAKPARRNAVIGAQCRKEFSRPARLMCLSPHRFQKLLPASADPEFPFAMFDAPDRAARDHQRDDAEQHREEAPTNSHGAIRCERRIGIDPRSGEDDKNCASREQSYF